MKNHIVFIIIVLIIIIFPAFLYKKRIDSVELNCTINDQSETEKGEGYAVISNILDETCKQKLFDRFYKKARTNKKLNEDIEVSLYTDDSFIKSLSKLIGEDLYPVNSLDSQRCWIRYYYEDMKAQYYENYHHDKKRYGSDVKQYRLVIPIYDTSDAVFTIEKLGSFPFTENTGVFLEAGNCLHKVKFTKGERLVLIMDYTTKPCDSVYGHYSCRGVIGYSWWVVDVLWRHLSSFYYKTVNN
jgi:hypothetical protein